MVPFLDAESGRIVRIPASVLRPGAIQIRLEPSGEVVWALPEQLQMEEIRHPEFDENIWEYIRQIHDTFAEHRPLSFEEWEDGFRRDADPAREIAIWSHAADIYNAFTSDEPNADRREDVYRCIVHVHDHWPGFGLAGSSASDVEQGGGRGCGRSFLWQVEGRYRRLRRHRMVTRLGVHHFPSLRCDILRSSLGCITMVPDTRSRKIHVKGRYFDVHVNVLGK